MTEDYEDAAHGGPGWTPRTASLREEIGHIWKDCGINSEHAPLKAVLMHRPGPEIESITEPDKTLMLSPPNPNLTRRQHDRLVEAYRASGVEVFYVEPQYTPPPNQMFVADLFFMTPEGAILARPASTVRAGEETFVARRLAALGIPLLCYIRGRGFFEGADACWINPDTMIVATGLRTNLEGATQITNLLHEMNIDVITVKLPKGTMHLMGALRFIDKNLAIGWHNRTPPLAMKTLKEHGYTVLFTPDEKEARQGLAINFVTLKPKHILMPSGNPATQTFYESHGIKCATIEMNEIHKAAGGIGCLTGILKRET
jgi:N-dimethylarginine dimethylaminohydrolase